MNEGMQSLDDLLLCVGYPGERHSIKEFVTPNQIMVKETLESIGSDIWDCWDWVCQQIKYPTVRNGRMFDYHAQNAFGIKQLKSSGEYFQLPYMSLLVGIGDCCDKSTVLASFLRNFMDSSSVYVSFGTFSGDQDIDHAWVTARVNGDWHILETTLPQAMEWKKTSELPQYVPVLHANDQSVMSKADLTQLFCGVKLDASRVLANVWRCWQCQQ